MDNISAYEIDWKADAEKVLKQIKAIADDIFEGTDYYAERNTTPREKDIDIFKNGESGRIGQLWPKKRSEGVTVLLRIELIKRIGNMAGLPDVTDVKPGKYPGWGGFDKISIDKTVEILNAVALK